MRNRPRSTRPVNHSVATTDCKWGSRGELPCGTCDICENDAAAHYAADHPPWMSTRDAQELVCS